MRPTDTFALVREVLAGNIAAREDLLARLRPRLVLWAASRMGPALRVKTDPEDLAQEILLALHAGLPTVEFEDARRFFAWVFKVAESRVADAARHVAAEKRRPAARDAATQASPSEAAIRGESFQRLHAAIAALPEDYSLVIRLRRIEELTCAETAERMRRSESAVRVLYFRALQALRESLLDEDCAARESE